MCKLTPIISLRLGAQDALLEHVVPCLRSVQVSIINKEIQWYCTFDSDTTEKDFELLSCCGIELLAYYTDPYTINEIYETIPFPKKIKLKDGFYWVYYRHEHNYFEE
jgi:hypothetical protein